MHAEEKHESIEARSSPIYFVVASVRINCSSLLATEVRQGEAPGRDGNHDGAQAIARHHKDTVPCLRFWTYVHGSYERKTRACVRGECAGFSLYVDFALH